MDTIVNGPETIPPAWTWAYLEDMPYFLHAPCKGSEVNIAESRWWLS